MATFSYTALDAANTYIRNTIVARSLRQATADLEKQGLSVITVKKEQKKTWLDFELTSGITLQEKILITRHLHTMMEAGVALDESLRTIAEQSTQLRIKTILSDLQASVQKGQPLHIALAKHPKYFPTLFVSLIKVGETSGKLDETLAYLLDQQENDYRLRTKIFNALLYPSIILTALILMVSLMLVFVIPRIESVLTSYDVQLPVQTRILIWLSKALTNYWYAIIPGIALIVYGFARLLKTAWGKKTWDDFLLWLPGVQSVVKEVNLARITRTLSSTLKSGLPIDRALELTASVVNHTRYRESLERATRFVRRGVPLGEVMRGRSAYFPPLSTRMIEVGEKTGKLDHMLTRLAVFYETSVDTKLTNLSSVIEPFLILFIGLVVGYVAISVMTPIWSFSQTV